MPIEQYGPNLCTGALGLMREFPLHSELPDAGGRLYLQHAARQRQSDGFQYRQMQVCDCCAAGHHEGNS